MKTKYFLLGVGVLLGVALVLTGWQFIQRPYTFRGSLIDPPVPAADFELTDQNDQPFRLSDQKGQIVLLFFGYTHCPDVCPLTLSHFKQIKAELGDQADQVRFVFVTVDPERDTAAALNEYLPNFDSQIVGLTGSMESLEGVWKAYGVYRAKQEVGSAAGYLMDHTARTYLIDQQGNWRLTYPFEMGKDEILQDVLHLLNNE
jgi:protein SCO1/2